MRRRVLPHRRSRLWCYGIAVGAETHPARTAGTAPATIRRCVFIFKTRQDATPSVRVRLEESLAGHCLPEDHRGGVDVRAATHDPRARFRRRADYGHRRGKDDLGAHGESSTLVALPAVGVNDAVGLHDVNNEVLKARACHVMYVPPQPNAPDATAQNFHGDDDRSFHEAPSADSGFLCAEVRLVDLDLTTGTSDRCSAPASIAMPSRPCALLGKQSLRPTEGAQDTPRRPLVREETLRLHERARVIDSRDRVRCRRFDDTPNLEREVERSE
jgi:hypothetical protein